MALAEHLIEIETRFWTEGSDYYKKHVDDQALVAFGSMAGVMESDAVAATVADGPRWTTPKIEVKGLIEPKPGFAILTYQASAQRPNGESYSAMVSSGYVERGTSWKLAFHQQTPM